MCQRYPGAIPTGCCGEGRRLQKHYGQGIKVIEAALQSVIYSSIEAVTKMLTLCPSELLQVSNLLIANVMLDCCNITTGHWHDWGFKGVDAGCMNPLSVYLW